MREPEIINVLKEPATMEFGDVICFNQFPGHSKVQVKGSSGLSIEQFSASKSRPSFRGIVLGFSYKGDTPTGIIIMPMAPILKDQRIPNNDKNLTIRAATDLKAMGVSTNVNWRINFMPFVLPITPRNFGLADEGDVMRLGSAIGHLKTTILNQIDMLNDKGILHSANFLPASTARQLRGQETRNYDNITGMIGQHVSAADRHNAEMAAAASARLAEAQRAERKSAKADAARALRDTMIASPSGRLAYNLGLRFKDSTAPDISLDSALELNLIDDDTFLTLAEIGFETMRTAFDGFRNNHTEVLGKLVGTGLTNDDEETFKAGLEIKIKSALTDFYKHFQNPEPREKELLQAHVIPYVAAPLLPAAIEKPAAPETPNIAAMSLSDAFRQGLIGYSTHEFLKDAKVPGTQQAPDTLGDAHRIVTEAPDSLREIFGLQSPKSKIRARIIAEVTAAISPPKPA